jgi:hypothetical protein
MIYILDGRGPTPGKDKDLFYAQIFFIDSEAHQSFYPRISRTLASVVKLLVLEAYFVSPPIPNANNCRPYESS